jgi:hypothetical protein
VKTRAEFLARFEETLCGFGLWGVTIDEVHPEDKRLTHAARAMKVPERSARLLNAMYSFLNEPAPTLANGQAKPLVMPALPKNERT